MVFTFRALRGTRTYRAYFAIIVTITVITATIIFANIVVVTTAVPLA
jgi:hypothetical protein